MSFSSPAHHIDRVPIQGEEGKYIKMFDPRPEGPSPALPERLLPTNPVPEVMQALGFGVQTTPRALNLRLARDLTLPTWDGGALDFFVFQDRDFDDVERYPGNTIRIPRGVVFHCESSSSKGPHTIHWHGIEPTPMNDGVGHTSFELGNYTYQFQPNFMGSYFYHCHRNTVQHFEFGLFGNLIVEAPDAYFASIDGADWRTQFIPNTIVLNDIPIGAGLDGRFRVAANLDTLPSFKRSRFPGYRSGDSTFGVAGAGDSGVGHPHAFTVPYDVEAMWVLDDRDSTWSNLANDVLATFPVYDANEDLITDPLNPVLPVVGIGENVDFRANPGDLNFFAFNDFRADYWYISGVPVPASRGGDAVISPPLSIPPRQNSGVSGTQIAVNAQVGQTILVRCLDAAYNSALVTFPIDVVIVAWDGRALGVPPFGRYSEAFEVSAGTPIFLSTARRFDAIIAATRPINSHATVTFYETRGGNQLVTARIPFVITG